MTTEHNRRHWAHADALSADAAASAEGRRTLRNRARYEVANNSYARGIVLTLANDTVGTGPRLQLLTDSDAVNRQVEKEFERLRIKPRPPSRICHYVMRYGNHTDALCEVAEALGMECLKS